jgi:hypothetical protein
MTAEKTPPEHRTLGRRFLTWSGINPVRLVLWLAAITIVSFVIGFGILAAGGGFPPAAGEDLSLFQSNAFHEPRIDSALLGGAESGSAKITLGAGRLSLGGGAPHAMFMESATFSKASEWQPDFSMSRNGSEIQVNMIEKGHRVKEWVAVDSPNRWDIRMNEQVPISLDVGIGAGDSRLNLGALNLSALSVDTGAGDTWIDLSGYHGRRFDAVIHSGIGDLTVRVPKNSTTRIEVGSGLGEIAGSGLIRENGSFITPGYNPAHESNTIRIKQGIGSITLEGV